MLNVKVISVGQLQSNCYILSDIDKRTAIIDPGDDFYKIDRYIVENDLKVEAIILTHGHFDHIGACSSLHEKYDCDVYIHKDDVTMLSDSFLNLSSRMFIRNIIFDKQVISVVDKTVSIIGRDFTFIHTPGHTPGSMCVLVDEMLFTGDTLFKLSVGNSFPPYGDLNIEISSIVEKIYSLDDITCYPGHGETTSVEYEKKFNPYTSQGEMWI